MAFINLYIFPYFSKLFYHLKVLTLFIFEIKTGLGVTKWLRFLNNYSFYLINLKKNNKI